MLSTVTSPLGEIVYATINGKKWYSAEDTSSILGYASLTTMKSKLRNYKSETIDDTSLISLPTIMSACFHSGKRESKQLLTWITSN